MAGETEGDPIGARLLRQDERAWSVVLNKIMPKAVAAIRRKFGPDRRYLGAEDVVDSAIASIFGRLRLASLVDGLNSWDDLQGLLVVVASRKLIDMLRKAKSDEMREGRLQHDKEIQVLDGGNSPVLKRFYQEESEREMDELLKQMLDALGNETERIVFRGKLDHLKESEIARLVARDVGGRMTIYMVRETWRAIRGRFHRMFPDLPWARGD